MAFARGILPAFAIAVTTAGAAAQDPLVSRLIAKAEAQEPESGFCATTSWRAETLLRLAGDTRFFDGVEVGSDTTFVDAVAEHCVYLRVAQIYAEGGRRCLRVQLWSCGIGRSCRPDGFAGCRGQQAYEWR